MNSTDHVYVVSDRWVSCPRPNAEARLRLFFFPYGGAGSTTYSSWAQLLPSEIEICLVHLPGRDKRISEPPIIEFSALTESLSKAILPYLDRPFSFFGHSMGGLVGFEVARQLRRQHSLLPAQLFISGRMAPHLPNSRPKLHGLPEKEFLAATEARYGALPQPVLDDRELLQLFLSILRADLTLIETYQYIHDAPLECPVTVFGGLQDHTVTQEELAAWRQQTKAQFDLRMFPGNHFFVQGSRMAIAQALNTGLGRFTHNKI